jgi:hypothetical protein
MDVGFFRWDYMSLWFEMEPDRFHLHLEVLNNLAAHCISSQTWHTCTKVKAFGEAGGGKRRYAFTAWGRAAGIVQYLPPEWARYVRRLDIKTWPPDLTEEGIIELRETLLRGKAGYNVGGQNGRPRQKTDKRDSGGLSCSIGSHKSDLRICYYARIGSDPCLEFQCSGDMLKRILSNVKMVALDSSFWIAFWLTVKDRIQQVGVARVNRALVNVGAIRWIPTTPEEREAADLDEVDRQASQLEEQARMDLDADQDRQGEAAST